MTGKQSDIYWAFCTMHVPIFVPKMDRDLLIHFREEQMPSVPQNKPKEFQRRDTYSTQRYFFKINVLVHMMEINEYHKYTSLVYLKIIHSSIDLFWLSVPCSHLWSCSHLLLPVKSLFQWSSIKALICSYLQLRHKHICEGSYMRIVLNASLCNQTLHEIRNNRGAKSISHGRGIEIGMTHSNAMLGKINNNRGNY